MQLDVMCAPPLISFKHSLQLLALQRTPPCSVRSSGRELVKPAGGAESRTGYEFFDYAQSHDSHPKKFPCQPGPPKDFFLFHPPSTTLLLKIYRQPCGNRRSGLSVGRFNAFPLIPFCFHILIGFLRSSCVSPTYMDLSHHHHRRLPRLRHARAAGALFKRRGNPAARQVRVILKP
jgi:hypothetical protein